MISVYRIRSCSHSETKTGISGISGAFPAGHFRDTRTNPHRSTDNRRVWYDRVTNTPNWPELRKSWGPTKHTHQNLPLRNAFLTGVLSSCPRSLASRLCTAFDPSDNEQHCAILSKAEIRCGSLCLNLIVYKSLTFEAGWLGNCRVTCKLLRSTRPSMPVARQPTMRGEMRS
jgi:hypothetical protein